ncbi:MAG TPA: NAD-dependent epimerase/dehydratase family protein [Bryobacteraceae bacterium]|nr:NAD-dependent epimerase/dehydratase family protein [Bryobacteraceae bacterium]
MKILVIGGTGFIGPFVVRDLVEQGHNVAVFHRGNAKPVLPDSVRRIVGDRNDLAAHRADFERFAPDVVVDFLLSDDRQAQALMECFRGLVSRVVAISSQDVYRAYEVLLRKTPGPLQELPITEEAELRTQLHPYDREQLRKSQAAFSWVTEDYDKIPVEKIVLGDARLPGTVLRLPMVYGPGDPLHRFFATVKRMDDGRRAIPIQEDIAKFIPPRGYVEDVAAAVVLATLSPRAAGRIYNIAADQHFSELDWARKIGDAMGWKGSLVPVPADKTPAHLYMPVNAEQNWIVSSKRIRDELGFAEPVALGDGIERTIAWERANPPAVDPKMFDYAAEDAAVQHDGGECRTGASRADQGVRPTAKA